MRAVFPRQSAHRALAVQHALEPTRASRRRPAAAFYSMPSLLNCGVGRQRRAVSRLDVCWGLGCEGSGAMTEASEEEGRRTGRLVRDAGESAGSVPRNRSGAHRPLRDDPSALVVSRVATRVLRSARQAAPMTRVHHAGGVPTPVRAPAACRPTRVGADEGFTETACGRILFDALAAQL